MVPLVHLSALKVNALHCNHCLRLLFPSWFAHALWPRYPNEITFYRNSCLKIVLYGGSPIGESHFECVVSYVIMFGLPQKTANSVSFKAKTWFCLIENISNWIVPGYYLWKLRRSTPAGQCRLTAAISLSLKACLGPWNRMICLQASVWVSFMWMVPQFHYRRMWLWESVMNRSIHSV